MTISYASVRCDAKKIFIWLLIFFFFQAEDGIRDHCVTGVQTCALPILDGGRRTAAIEQRCGARHPDAGLRAGGRRSEERRVGKECRSTGSAHQYKKKHEKLKDRQERIHIHTNTATEHDTMYTHR